jgi:predicted membrane protein DUF2142
VTKLSEQRLRWVVLALCAVAAIRAFIFAAGFPFFNNVDEQAHVDLVVKYAQGKPPRGIEPFASEPALYFAVYSSPEYFVKPEQYGGEYPPPAWLLSPEERQEILDNEIPSWESRPNHESGEPPLYYALAGAWFDLGHLCDFRGLTSLYWVRFLNIAFAAVLVWLGYKTARIVFPNQQFPALATATLLAIWPQGSFYSIQGDSLSPVIFGIAFLALAKLLRSDRPTVLLAFWIGLTLAATCLIKNANLPLVFVVAIAVIFKVVQLSRKSGWSHQLWIFLAFLISTAVPLGLWFGWNSNHFGDLIASRSKIELLGWTPKAFADWWSHPIFTTSGAKDFWAELIASFWRGEFIWHRERLATWWSDAFYWTASTVALGIAVASLATHKRSEPNRGVLWSAFFSFASLVGFLVLLSIRFDFRDCPYPSREHPYFTSGRLLNAAAVPFFLLFVYAIERVAAWTKREWPRWVLLGVIAALVFSWQVSINAPVLSSRYNFFHRAALK